MPGRVEILRATLPSAAPSVPRRQVARVTPLAPGVHLFLRVRRHALCRLARLAHAQGTWRIFLD